MFHDNQLAGVYLTTLGIVAALSIAVYIYAAPLVPADLMPRRYRRRLQAWTMWAPRAMAMSVLLSGCGVVLFAAAP